MKTSYVTYQKFANVKKQSFAGHSHAINDRGLTSHKFYLPFDTDRYTAKLEMCRFKDVKGNWEQVDSNTTIIDLPPEGLEMPENDLLGGNTVVGYRFILSDKYSGKRIYKVDAGLQTKPDAYNSEETFALLLPNRTVLTRNGLTKQVMPDICFPGYFLNRKTGEIEFNKAERNRALNAVRTHGTKLGGNFAGIIRMLPVWKNEGYTKIVGTPFTRDDVSSHLYWTENPYQTASSVGSVEDFRFLQQELFKNGINFIADGAFVNQGLQGTLFKHVLKHGLSSPFATWFKASGLISNTIQAGAIPSNPEARENFRFRLVNAPYSFVEKNGKIKLKTNREYDKTKLTYIQLYDKRLVTKEELKNTNNLIKRYSITNTSNPYDITGHDDITQLLSFEIKPEILRHNIKKALKDFPAEKRSFDNNSFVENLLSFDNLKITTKDKGGVDLWDGNMDIAKLNFYYGNTDQLYLDKFSDSFERSQNEKEFKNSIYQVQHFALNAVRYWTRLAKNAQIEYAAKTLSFKRPELKLINENIKYEVAKGKLPECAAEVMNEELIKNVLNGSYTLPKKENTQRPLRWRELYVQKAVNDYPLEAIEFSPDLTAVLASPYITPRPDNKADLLKSTYDLREENEMTNRNNPNKVTKLLGETNEVIEKELTKFVDDVFLYIDFNLPEGKKLFTKNKEKVTDYGKYVIAIFTPEIVKYAIVKGIKPSANIGFDKEKGTIDYSKADLPNISLKTLNIDSYPEKEAELVIKQLKYGLHKLNAGQDKHILDNVLRKRLTNITLDQFKIADAIVERTESGLGWRIDAAKDIANIDAIRTQNDNDEALFKSVIDFWGEFNKVAKAENKHVYTTAEITDLNKVIINPNNEFKNSVNAETKFIERSGLNNTANYMFFYSMLKDLFSKDSEDGKKIHFNDINEFQDKLINGWRDENGNKICNGFLYQYPDDAISNSYTFLGNHDKPRVLHIFALDMDLFHSDITTADHKNRARRVLNLGHDQNLSEYKLSGKSIAMGERILLALERVGAILPYEKYNSANEQAKIDNNTLRYAVADLASGNFKGKNFNPDAFGTRDFNHALKHVFEQAEFLGYKNPNANAYKNAALQNILEPAMDKMETVYKMLVTLPGSPTDFVGDKEGSSGYETKSNNNFQQNRNTVPFEWINATLMDKNIDSNNNKPFVNNYYARMNQIGALRNKPELSALTNGNTVALPLQNGKTENGMPINAAATFRYNDKGSAVICLYTTAGANDDNYYKMNHPTVNFDEIKLDGPYWKEGIKGGLKQGEIFKKYGDNSTYQVVLENNTYKLKRTGDSIYKAISILPEDKNTAVFYKVSQQAYKPRLIYPNMDY